VLIKGIYYSEQARTDHPVEKVQFVKDSLAMPSPLMLDKAVESGRLVEVSEGIGKTSLDLYTKIAEQEAGASFFGLFDSAPKIYYDASDKNTKPVANLITATDGTQAIIINKPAFYVDAFENPEQREYLAVEIGHLLNNDMSLYHEVKQGDGVLSDDFFKLYKDICVDSGIKEAPSIFIDINNLIGDKFGNAVSIVDKNGKNILIVKTNFSNLPLALQAAIAAHEVGHAKHYDVIASKINSFAYSEHDAVAIDVKQEDRANCNAARNKLSGPLIQRNAELLSERENYLAASSGNSVTFPNGEVAHSMEEYRKIQEKDVHGYLGDKIKRIQEDQKKVDAGISCEEIYPIDIPPPTPLAVIKSPLDKKQR
ncbi:MAG: hypothetical protein WCL30_04300, partial [Pseudomonadota bacterium]